MPHCQKTPSLMKISQALSSIWPNTSLQSPIMIEIAYFSAPRSCWFLTPCSEKTRRHIECINHTKIWMYHDNPYVRIDRTSIAVHCSTNDLLCFEVAHPSLGHLIPPVGLSKPNEFVLPPFEGLHNFLWSIRSVRQHVPISNHFEGPCMASSEKYHAEECMNCTFVTELIFCW